MILHNDGYREEATYREVSPLRVATYLRANGWQEKRQDDRIAIWTYLPADAEPDDYFEILLPLRPDFRDFVPRMAELFDTLEQAEQRDRNDILDSLAIAGADVVNLRLMGDNVSNGSIPFAEAVRLTQRSYDLLQAAAKAFPANSPIEDVEVRSFVERASKRTGASSAKVTIVGDVDGQPRRVEAILTGDIYRMAVQAHKEEKSIACYGIVERKGHRYALISPHGFQVQL